MKHKARRVLQWFPFLSVALLLACDGIHDAPAPLAGDLEMIPVPEGSFVMGREAWPEAEPEHGVTLSRSFELSRFEITNAQYIDMLNWAWEQGRLAVHAGSVYLLPGYAHPLYLLNADGSEIFFIGSRFLPRRHDLVVLPEDYDPDPHPVKCVTWYGAAFYCDYLSLLEGLQPVYSPRRFLLDDLSPYEQEGYRLPTEAEWERAARFDDGRLYPWGNQGASQERVVYGNAWSEAVGSRPLGRSRLGLEDLSGNVWEWVHDRYGMYTAESRTDPFDNGGEDRRAMRGGYWATPPLLLSTVTRSFGDPDKGHKANGFRVCRTAPEQ